MLRLLSKIENLPVIPQNLGAPVGTIKTYVFDPAKGKIVAYELNTRAKNRYFSSIDVLKYYDDGILISDRDVLQPIEELIRVQQLLKPRIRLQKLRVVSESGKRLGRTRDCSIDTTGHFLARLYVTPNLPERIFTEHLIVQRQQILEVTPSHITVRYDKEAPETKAEPVATPKPEVAS